MKFEPLPRMFDDQPVWGCCKGQLTFVITKDEDGYTASVKIAGGKRIDLGGYCAHSRFVDAENACRKFYRHRQ